MLSRRAVLAMTALACVVPVLAACGGEDSAAPEAAETPPTTTDDTVTTTPATDTGSPRAAGTGEVELADGRVFTITVSECVLQPTGSFTAEGTGEAGATFEMTQLHLGDEWSRTQADLAFPNGDRVGGTASSVVEGAEPAVVDAGNVAWASTFRELDVSANRYVYDGAGTVRLSCP